MLSRTAENNTELLFFFLFINYADNLHEVSGLCISEKIKMSSAEFVISTLRAKLCE